MKTKLRPLFFLLFFFYCSTDEGIDVNKRFNGSLVFANTFGGSNNESLLSVKRTNDGGYIAVGHTQSNDHEISDKSNISYDYWVLKFSAEDQLIWSKTFGGSDDDRARDVIALDDGSFIISGFSRSSDEDVSENSGNYDFWIIKIDGTGNLIWEKSFGFEGPDQAYTLLETSDGNILVGGTLDVSASGGLGNSKPSKRHAGGDYWLIKLDSNGNKIWTRYFGGLFTDILFGIEEAENSNFILVGSSDSKDTDISNNIGSYDYWVVKVDANGSLIWDKSFGGQEIDEAFSVTKTNSGNFIIAGNSRSSENDISDNNGSSDIWLIQIDTDGNLIWERNFGGSSFEVAKKIIPASNNGFYIAGSSRSSDMDLDSNNGNKDGWLIKINAQGDLIWQKSIGGINLEDLNGITEIASGAIIAVGESWSNDFDIIENKGFSDALITKIE